MSHKTKTIKTEQKVVESYTCDACGTTLAYDGLGENQMELQEWLHWRMRGGFNSIFGDEADLSLDLCQPCIKARLGDVLQIGPNWLEQVEPLETES